MPRNRPRRPVEALAAKMLARIDPSVTEAPDVVRPGRRRTRGTQLAVCSWCGQAYTTWLRRCATAGALVVGCARLELPS